MSERDPDDVVTATFVATSRPDVAQVEIDGEIVLYDDRAKVMHRLSPTAGQVWRCLDGSGSLAEISADLADVYQADPGQVLADVVATARRFGSAGLLVGVGDPPDSEDADDPPEHEPREPDGPFVPEPAASCMDGSFPLGEAGTLTVKVGRYLLGVRFSTPELVDIAREVLAPSLVEGVVAPPNVSVVATRARAGRPLLYCYRSTMLVDAGSQPAAGVGGRGQLAHELRPTRPRRRAPACPGCHADRRGGAVLLRKAGGLRPVWCPGLRAAGWEVLDAPEVDLDPEGNVVIADSAVALDAAALARLPAHRSDETPPGPGRYPVAAWVAVAGEDPVPETMAGRVALVAAGMPDLDAESAPSAFETTSVMLSRAAWAVSPTLNANDLAATLARALP